MKLNKKPLILIVDDDMKNIQIIGNLLIESGYNIQVILNGKQAISTAKSLNPDLIILDLLLPDVNCFEVCKEISSDSQLSTIPVVFLAEKHESKDILNGFAAGGVDFITKPFQKEEVIARIANQIELKLSKDLLLEQSNEIQAMNDKLNEDLTIAADYFRSLLPQRIENEVIKTSWRYVPTARLGGDAFGYFQLDNHNWAIYLFDVSGHGIASGMYSVSLINTLKYQNLSETNFHCPESVFTALNKIFQIHEHNGMYFTIWYGVYNSQSRQLRFATAGHHPAIISYPDGTTEFLSSPNFIIGGLNNYKFSSKVIDIPQNSDIYIFSDGTYGLTLPDGKIWNIDDMRQFLEARHSRGDKELNELYDFVSNLYEFSYQKDDFTILKVRFK